MLAKAHVLAALFQRAIVEDHPEHRRAEALRVSSARWLHEVGAWDLAVEPLEASIFDAPRRSLSSGQRTDCDWSGEHLAVLAWALQLGERPPEWQTIDGMVPTRAVGFMQPHAIEVSRSARLRPVDELREFFKRVSLVRWATHEARLGGGSDRPLDGARRFLLEERLAAVGLVADEGDRVDARDAVRRMGQERLTDGSSIPGLLVVRQLSAEWVLGCRGRKFWDPGAEAGD